MENLAQIVLAFAVASALVTVALGFVVKTILDIVLNGRFELEGTIEEIPDDDWDEGYDEGYRDGAKDAHAAATEAPTDPEAGTTLHRVE